MEEVDTEEVIGKERRESPKGIIRVSLEGENLVSQSVTGMYSFIIVGELDKNPEEESEVLNRTY